MVIYSHSRLSSFEQCSLKFKYRYIDKIKPDLETSIEAHLGKMVHETLEWIYRQAKENKLPSVEQVITYYAEKWQENYKQGIVIVRKNLTAKDYFNKGVGFLVNYYMKHQPFQDNTLEIEKRILIDLDDEGKYKLQGFIDRLVHNKEKDEYEIHDYKTANSLPTKEKVENDRQLALYSIGIKELYGREKNVLLIWHYLAHNTKICSKRTNQQLSNLKKEIIELIKKIEACTEFNSNKTILCNWCEYKTMCPEFGGKPPEKQNTLEI